MNLELDMARERVTQLRIEAEQYRLGKQLPAGKGAWRRLFAASRWGGSHRRSGQLM